MQLTTQRLKQIIKEELEAIVSEMSDETETELTPEEEKVASLEQQLAEAKDKAKKAAMKGKGTPQGTRNMNVGKRPAQAAKMKKAPEGHKMSPLKKGK